jgi:hypothetical protein
MKFTTVERDTFPQTKQAMPPAIESCVGADAVVGDFDFHTAWLDPHRDPRDGGRTGVPADVG